MEGLVSSTHPIFACRLLKSLILTAIALFISAGNAFAYRPFQTEDADVAGKGVFQTELSWDYLKWKNGDEDNVFLLVSPIYGPTESLELSAEIPYIYHKPKDEKAVNGIGDINLVAKQVLLKESAFIPMFTVKGVIKLDTGNENKGLGTGGIDYSLIAVASKNIGQLALHGQFGHTWVGNKRDGNFQNMVLYGFAADYGITEPFHVVAEVYGNQNPVKKLENLDNVLVGVTYKVSESLILDASLRRGLNGASLSWGGGVGLAYEYK